MKSTQSRFWKKSGQSIKISWPVSHQHDPNMAYRPWLENHIGQQGRDWDWRLSGNDIELKVSKKHSKQLTIIALTWNIAKE